MSYAKTCDESAALVAELFEQYHRSIFAYLYRLIADAECAHDLTQETFLRVLRARQRLLYVENRRAWVYRVATNLAFRALKRNRRFVWLPWYLFNSCQSKEPDTIEQVESRNAIELALATLPLTYRVPLLLFSHYGFTIREVAETLETSEGAVKTRLHRARELFRRAYEKGTRDDGSSTD